MAESFMPTLKTLFDAPDTSPLSEVKVINVAELMVQLTNARHQLSKARSGDDTTLTVCLLMNNGMFVNE